jgi:hypothetical protein
MPEKPNRYVEAITRILRAPAKSDGCSNTELTYAEKKLGVKLPPGLREFYAAAGRIDQINLAHNRLLKPEEIRIEGGYLIFYEENQVVVQWGLPVKALKSDDPPVFQCPGEPENESDWYQESDSVSRFLMAMTHAQAAVGGLPYCVTAALTDQITANVKKTFSHVVTMNEYDIYASDGQVIFRMTAGSEPELYAAGRTENDLNEICSKLSIPKPKKTGPR